MPPAPPPPPAPRPRWEQHAVFGAASAVCALFLVRVIVLFYQKDYGRAVDAARGVVTGHPHWRVYQSRVLGPWIVELLAHLLPSFAAAHVAYSLLTLALAGFLVLTFTQRQYGDAGRSWAAFFMFQSLFVFLMSRPWLYAWDYIDILVFLVFFDLVQRGQAWPRVLALFAVAIFNRESALFVGLWLVVEPIVAFVYDRRARGRKAGMARGPQGRRARKRHVRLAWRPCLAGALGLTGGLGVIEALRRSLLVEEMGPLLFADVKVSPEQGFDPANLVANLQRMEQSLTTLSYSMDFLLVPFLVSIVVLAVVLARRDPRRWLALSLVHLGLLGSLLFHGYFFETRIYLGLVPFVVLGVQTLFPGTTGADGPTQPST
jgi:hypothetical protein